MKRIHIVFCCVFIAIAASFTSGCGKDSAASHNPTKNHKVTLMLSWSPSAEHAFLYYGKKLGLFAAEGIELAILPSRGSGVVSTTLNGGGADFGLISGDTLIMSRDGGGKLKALATLIHRSPVSIFSPKSKGISKPIDLVGKRVGGILKSAAHQQFLLMLKKQGIDPSAVEIVPSVGSTNELLEGKADALEHYTQYGPVSMRASGKEINEILLREWGVDVVSTSLATTEKIIKNQPEIVARFLRAFIASLAASERDQDGTINALLSAEPALDRKELVLSYAVVKEMLYGGATPIRGLGYLDKNEWTASQLVLLEGGLVTKVVAAESFYDDRFLKRSYE